MSRFNLNNNHQIIPNDNEYFYEPKYVSIHSEDRDIIKYPKASEFEIELPQDYLNVASMRLSNWAFPSNYDVFSKMYNNLLFIFRLTIPYVPEVKNVTDPNTYLILKNISDVLVYYLDETYEFLIESGFYTPTQMATELTNKFNLAVTIKLLGFFENQQNQEMVDYLKQYPYDRFIVVYNEVNQKLWFGNTAEGFMLNNASTTYGKISSDVQCVRKDALPDSTNWGLPANLGLARKDEYSVESLNYYIVPRFYYGDVLVEGDNGVWLKPSEPGANVYFIEAPYKINLMGNAYFYMELHGYNAMDETSPYNLSKFTVHTNETNGVCNSAFAKIGVLSTPISQWYDDNALSYSYFNPPLERLRKLKIRIRYHNNLPVEFGLFEYSFVLEINLLRPRQNKTFGMTNAYDLTQSRQKIGQNSQG